MINFATILSLIAPFVVLAILGFTLRRVLARPAPTSRIATSASRAAVARVAAADESVQRAAARERQVA